MPYEEVAAAAKTAAATARKQKQKEKGARLAFFISFLTWFAICL